MRNNKRRGRAKPTPRAPKSTPNYVSVGRDECNSLPPPLSCATSAGSEKIESVSPAVQWPCLPVLHCCSCGAIEPGSLQRGAPQPGAHRAASRSPVLDWPRQPVTLRHTTGLPCSQVGAAVLLNCALCDRSGNPRMCHVVPRYAITAKVERY